MRSEAVLSCAAPAKGKQGGRVGPEDQQSIRQKQETSLPQLGKTEDTAAEGVEGDEWMDGGRRECRVGGAPEPHPEGPMRDFVDG